MGGIISIVIKFFIAVFTLLFYVKCDLINLGVCCPPSSETFQDGNCTQVQDPSLNISVQKLHDFLRNHPNFTNNAVSLQEDVDFSFSLTHQSIISSCSNGTSVVLIKSSNASSKLFLTNGFLKYGDDYFHPKEYCINKISSLLDYMELIVCEQQQCSPHRPCIPKCCDMDQVGDLSLYPGGPIRCRPSGNISWTPAIYSDLRAKKPIEFMNTNQPRIVVNHPRNWCESDVNIYSLKSSDKFKKKDIFKILSDGNVWIKRDKWKWKLLSPGTFCLDGGQNFNFDENATTFIENLADTILVDCTDHSKDFQACHSNNTGNPSIAYAVSFFVASIFLLITVSVYILLWEKQNIHGWTSISYFASLFAMYIFTALYKMDYLMFVQNEKGYGCLTVAIGAHFFWLSTFCWMSCVNFDLWWTFRSLLPTGAKSKGLSRFMAYVLFSLGIPSIIVGVAIVLDYFYKNDIESDIITPDYGKFNCFLDQEYALLPYLYGPIAVLLSCNLIFFSVTIYDMYKIQQSTKFASASSSKNPKQKQSLLLFAKLFLLMGIPWAFEVISWATTPCGEISWYWKIFDYINIFQAFAIFLAFVCKSDTINSLEAKFPKFKRILAIATINPVKSGEFLSRHPNLKFMVKPFTRNRNAGLRAVSSTKTVSTGVDSAIAK